MRAEKSRPLVRATNPDSNYPDSTPYPARIVLSAAAEKYLDRLACDLVLGRVELHQLSPALMQIHAFAFSAGRDSQQAALDRANRDADRYYCAAYNPPLTFDHNRPSYAQLERIRGNTERADQIEADLATLFGGDAK